MKKLHCKGASERELGRSGHPEAAKKKKRTHRKTMFKQDCLSFLVQIVLKYAI